MARHSPVPVDVDVETSAAVEASAVSMDVVVVDTTISTGASNAFDVSMATADSTQAASLPAAPTDNSSSSNGSNDKKRPVMRRYVAQEDREQQALLAAVANSLPNDSTTTTASSNGTTALPATGEKRKRGGGERLNDAQRLEIIRLRRQENPPSLRKIAREFNVSDRSIRNVMLSAADIEKRNVNVDIKFQLRTFRMAAPRFPELEERTFAWIMELRQAQMHPTPTAIIEKARAIAADMGITPSEFKASPGWFERFRKRRHLVDKRMSVGGNDSSSDRTHSSALDAAAARLSQNLAANGVGSELSGSSSVGLDDGSSSSDGALLPPSHLALQQQLLMLQPQTLQTQAPLANESVGVYDLVHAIVDLESKLRTFQRTNPSESGRLQQCLANATVIRHDLLAVHANMQVRSLRAGMTPPKAPGNNVQLHGLGDLA